MIKNNQNRYLSPKQIYEIYGIELKKIYFWIRQKRIDYIKAGIKTVLVPEAKLIEFLENNMVNRTPLPEISQKLQILIKPDMTARLKKIADREGTSPIALVLLSVTRLINEKEKEYGKSRD